MELCCGGPVILVAAFLLWRLWRGGGNVGRGVALGCGTVLGVFVLLVVYAEGRYIVLDEGIVQAACEGDAAGVRWRLALGASASTKDDNGLGALSCAATNGHVGAVRALLEHGADPDAVPDDNGDPFWAKTPREWAKASGDPELIRLFARFPRRAGREAPKDRGRDENAAPGA